jgi:hypothetical protein
VHEPKGGGRKAISKSCHSINRYKMWIVDAKNLIGKYVRNWKHATVVCFTALSRKSAGGSEKNHNENPATTVGLPAWIKMRQSKSRHFRLPEYDALHAGLQEPSYTKLHGVTSIETKILISAALRNSKLPFLPSRMDSEAPSFSALLTIVALYFLVCSEK